MKLIAKLQGCAALVQGASLGTLAAVLALVAVPAAAGNITEYIGVDNGAPITGPFPASSMAQSMFEAAASGLAGINTITFENLPVGFSASFTAAPGVTVDVNAPDLGPAISGINDVTLGNLNGFNITPNGTQWFGFPQGSATFNFATPTQSFGFWLTGVQASMLTSLTVSFNDGAPEALDGPIQPDGGAAFFGFTDQGAAITSLTITGVGNDDWGIDDVTYNSTSGVVLPEPSSLLLLASGITAVLGTFRRKPSK